jgi:alpha/beta superfamily hydrolase
VKEIPVRFPSASVELEGVLYMPEERHPDSIIVVCHPHPQYGGDMYSNVVSAVVGAATEAGLGALIFNFRGAGGSEGSFDGGKGEGEDVRAAIAFARSETGVPEVLLAGYSFGAAMAAAVVDASVTALLLVALPPSMARADDVGLRDYRGPVFMVSGSADHISPAADLQALAEALPSNPEIRVIEGADHFWWGHERALADCVRDFLSEQVRAGKRQD